MKLFSGILAGLVLLVVAGFVGVKMFVGAVNFPLGSTEVRPEGLQHLLVPADYQLELYANDVPNARELLLTSNNDLLVANPNRDEIWLLAYDTNNDGRHDGKRLVIDQLNGPNGMDFYTDADGNNWLYIAETDAIGRVRFDHAAGTIVGEYERLVTGLPGGGNHWKKSLRFGPDDLIYVTFGSSCNVCIEKDRRRATMMRYKPDGSGEEIFASGLRNSEGFDWSPRDGALYATDNGRDLLGDDFPPCEFNRIEQGAFYGWPFANGNRIADPDEGEGRSAEIEKSIAPVHGFRAHNAPLGMTFLRQQSSPDYQHAALVALHGSWNRSTKDGYKVVSLHWQPDGSVVERDFMTGFLDQDVARGRPAEIVEDNKGAIYIADDFAGAIYRVKPR